MSNELQVYIYYVMADPKVGEQHIRRNRLTAVLLKILDIYYFNHLAKIGLTHSHSAIEFQSIDHLVGKEKGAEQQILAKYSKCNSFKS